MRKIVLGLVAAVVLFAAAPSAYSQGVGVDIRTGDRDRSVERRGDRRDGVRVRVGEDRRVDRRRVHVIERRRGCRTIVTKRRLPNGTVVVRRVRKC